MGTSNLRTDLLDPKLLKTTSGIKVVASNQFQGLINRAERPRTTTPGAAKDIIEVMDLIQNAILDCEKRTRTTTDGKIDVVFEYPTKAIDVETISISFQQRVPGGFGQGAPMESSTHNRKAILREVVDDEDNPGYKRAVFGYLYDNVLRLTAWARTNKAANARAIWIETLMDEYMWYFVHSGVNRILFEGWQKSEVLDIGDNTFYGRPIEYYVKTEKITTVSQKTLEDIMINLAISNT